MNNKFRSKILRHLKTQIHLFKTQLVNSHRIPIKKNVHQLRITSRRIRAAIWIIEHGTPHLSFKKLLSELRKLSRVLGQLRELDVAIQDANKYHLKTSKLKKKRQSARNTLLSQTNSRHRKKIVTYLNKALIKIQNHQEQKIASGVVVLRKRILPWAQKKIVTEDDFHRLRILTKKTRYILETIGKPVQPLRELQDVLGKGHDLEVLQDFSKRNPKIQNASKEQYRSALHMVRPTLHFAVKQLSTGMRERSK